MSNQSGSVKWTAIVLTCSDKQWSQSLQQEFELRQAKGLVDKETILLTVEDPQSHVGSGGATINALLAITEYISACKGYTVINADVLKDAYILILHSGRTYTYSSCRHAFLPLPVKYFESYYDSLVCLVDLTLNIVTRKIATPSPPGIWVASTDMMLSIPEHAVIRWPSTKADVYVVTVPSSENYCKEHGVFKTDQQGYIEDIKYQPDNASLLSCIQPSGDFLIVCGIVYFNKIVAEKLLSFHVKPPLDSCTYIGLDSGQKIKELSLFFDVLLPMATGVTEDDFNSKNSETLTKEIRQILWDELHDFKICPYIIEAGQYNYLATSSTEFLSQIIHCPLKMNASKSLVWNPITHSSLGDTVDIVESSVVINSILQGQVTIGPGSVVTNCYMNGHIQVGKESICSGLKMELNKKTVKFADSIVIQGFNIHLKTLQTSKYVLTIHGILDQLMVPLTNEDTTFCNQKWKIFLQNTGISEQDLCYANEKLSQKTLMDTKLFPVFHPTENISMKEMLWLQGQLKDDTGYLLKRWRESWRLSLSEILKLVDFNKEFSVRREQFYNICKLHIKDTLLKQKNQSLRPIYNSIVLEPSEFSEHLLKTLDDVAIQCSQTPATAARTLANIADLLGCMAKGKGGLRSGPAANIAWNKAFNLLEANQISTGVKALAKVRNDWLHRADLLIRASRHYEGAAQILIRHAVMTGKKFVEFQSCMLPDYDHWIKAECPARLDLSGGWSDTPPITYEHGGAVTGVSITVNGKKPIGAKVKRIKNPVIVLVSEVSQLVIQNLLDMEDYTNPYSSGALVKAAFICTETITLSSSMSLKEQLMSKYQGGFEVHTWTNLPQGSGLGTSSILAGAVIAAICTATGKKVDSRSLIHLIIYLEQLLTTGGGWQDQVAGLLGGVTTGMSEAKIPLFIDLKQHPVSSAIIKEFNKLLILIYTGKTRLARNLLQNVVRDWYARKQDILSTVDQLEKLAHFCSDAFQDGNLPLVGQCVDRYWELKKKMAPGCEPAAIRNLMQNLRPHVFGMSLAGAGGGGFFYAIAKDSSLKIQLNEIISKIPDLKGAVIYNATVDTEGMKLIF